MRRGRARTYSESTFYRILRAEDQLAHRQRSRPATHRRPAEHRADGPEQVWSWDITYLKSPVRGQFYFLYMILDVWSHKIVGAATLLRLRLGLPRYPRGRGRLRSAPLHSGPRAAPPSQLLLLLGFLASYPLISLSTELPERISK